MIIIPCIFRRIWIMGLWGPGPGDGVVPTAVAPRVEHNRHFCQGAGASGAVSCSVGPHLAGLAHPFSFRQYGSGRHLEKALWQGPISTAPHEVLLFFTWPILTFSTRRNMYRAFSILQQTQFPAITYLICPLFSHRPHRPGSHSHWWTCW